MLNEIPVEYFCNLDQNGRRKDLDERPELSLGTVEYVAPAGDLRTPEGDGVGSVTCMSARWMTMRVGAFVPTNYPLK